MVIETLISKGMGWKDAGKWYWDVYVADVQGQPSLYSGGCGSKEEANRACSKAYYMACREYMERAELT